MQGSPNSAAWSGEPATDCARPGSTSAGALTVGTVDPDTVAVAGPVDLAPAGVGDHQYLAGGLPADGIEAADPVHRKTQCVTVGRGGRHTDPQSGERTGTAADDDGIEVGHRAPSIGDGGQAHSG